MFLLLLLRYCSSCFYSWSCRTAYCLIIIFLAAAFYSGVAVLLAPIRSTVLFFLLLLILLLFFIDLLLSQIYLLRKLPLPVLAIILQTVLQYCAV